MTDDDGGRERLLEAMLAHVPLDGWSREALDAGARDAGLDAGTAALLLPGGARQALTAFSRRADGAMVAGVAPDGLAGLRMHERVGLLVERRLDALAPHREAVRRGLGYLALPPNLALGSWLLYRTVDDIWHAAGDRSADFSFYTKRGLLAGVVASTTMHWIGDGGADRAGTRRFLERRLADVMGIHRARGRMSGLGRTAAAPLHVLRDALRERYGRGGERRVT